MDDNRHAAFHTTIVLSLIATTNLFSQTMDFNSNNLETVGVRMFLCEYNGKEAPEKYESYADMALNEWIKVKIVIKDTNAQLYINDAEKPSLIIEDLKHGENLFGSVGLWVDTGTEGYFSDLKIIQ